MSHIYDDPPSMFNLVQEFQVKVLGNSIPNEPQLLSKKDAMYLVGCVCEELDEFMDAQAEGDIAGVADALADAIYFMMGFAARMGLPFNKVCSLVHDANMQKVIGMTHRGNPADAAKPDGWQDPKLKIKELLCKGQASKPQCS